MDNREFTFTICGTENPIYDKIFVNQIPELYYRFKVYDFYGTERLHKPTILPYGVTEEVIERATREMRSWALSYHGDLLQDMDFGNKVAREFFFAKRCTATAYTLSEKSQSAMDNFADRIFIRDKITTMFDCIDDFGYKFVIFPSEMIDYGKFIINRSARTGDYVLTCDSKPGISLTFTARDFNGTSKIHAAEDFLDGKKASDSSKEIAKFSSMAADWISFFHYNLAFPEEQAISMADIIGCTMRRRRSFLMLDDEEMKYRLGDKNRKTIIRFEKSNFEYQNANKFFDCMNVLELSCAIVEKDYCDIHLRK